MASPFADSKYRDMHYCCIWEFPSSAQDRPITFRWDLVPRYDVRYTPMMTTMRVCPDHKVPLVAEVRNILNKGAAGVQVASVWVCPKANCPYVESNK